MRYLAEIVLLLFVGYIIYMTFTIVGTQLVTQIIKRGRESKEYNLFINRLFNIKIVHYQEYDEYSIVKGWLFKKYRAYDYWSKYYYGYSTIEKCGEIWFEEIMYIKDRSKEIQIVQVD